MQVFLFSPTPVTCQCLSLTKPSQKPLSQEAGKHSLQRSTSQGAVSIERQSWRRVENASKQDVEIISLLFCFPGQWATWEQGTYSPLWHQGPSRAQWLWQIFHRPPCRRFYIPTHCQVACSASLWEERIFLVNQHQIPSCNLLWPMDVGIPSPNRSFESLCVA